VPLLQLDPTGKEQITRDVRRLVSYVAGEPDTGWAVAPQRQRWWQFWRSRREDAPSVPPPTVTHSPVPVASALALAEAEAARRLLQDGPVASSLEAADAPSTAPDAAPAAALGDAGEDQDCRPNPEAVAASSESSPQHLTNFSHRPGSKRQGRCPSPASERRRRRGPAARGSGKVRASRPAMMQNPAAGALAGAVDGPGSAVDEDDPRGHVEEVGRQGPADGLAQDERAEGPSRTAA
jgi:hypothetical protein